MSFLTSFNIEVIRASFLEKSSIDARHSCAHLGGSLKFSSAYSGVFVEGRNGQEIW